MWDAYWAKNDNQQEKKKTLERKKKYFWEFEPIILNVAVMLAEKDS